MEYFDCSASNGHWKSFYTAILTALTLPYIQLLPFIAGNSYTYSFLFLCFNTFMGKSRENGR